MEIIADLHFHSKYSRAVSRDMTIPTIRAYAKKKGIMLTATTDWTHPLWIREIKNELEEAGEGVYELKGEKQENDPKFILSVEVSSIYKKGDKVRRIHTLLFVPSIEVAEKVNKELVKRGVNLASDGRPIMGLTPPNLIEIMMGIDERSFLIPCHVWTPWFALYGSMSGFDSIEECFGDYSKYIYGVETGLSSDPVMNWRIDELKNRSILSNSDSHSPMKMGREATVFVPKTEISNDKSQMTKFTYDDIRLAIMRHKEAKLKIGYTIEFYPEEGKYHYTGHRNCGVSFSPKEMKKSGVICPVCKKNLTVGVMQRIEDLANRKEWMIEKTGKSGVKWIMDPEKNHPPYAKLVPLNEIIAQVLGMGVASQKVKNMYEEMIKSFGSEFEILLKVSTDKIESKYSKEIAAGISKVRSGDIYIKPGFDGEYGIVKIESDEEMIKNPEVQKALF